MTRFALSLALALGLAATSGARAQAAGDNYPVRPVKLIVGYVPGESPDTVARIVSQRLGQILGQPVVVENRAGAGGTLATAQVAKAPADGYTLLLGETGQLVIAPWITKNLSYDVIRDFTPVGMVGTTPLVLVASPQMGVKTLKEALDAARKTPGIAYGSPGNGSPMHFAGEMLKKSAGVDLLHVPYRGVAPSITAALGGEVKLLFTGLGGAIQHVKSGKLVPLALTEKSRSALMPSIPTATEQGVPNVEVNAWYGVFAPTGTPQAAIQRIIEGSKWRLSEAGASSGFTSMGLSSRPISYFHSRRLGVGSSSKWRTTLSMPCTLEGRTIKKPSSIASW